MKSGEMGIYGDRALHCRAAWHWRAAWHARAALVLVLLNYAGPGATARALQILEAADHGELSAEISGEEVNRIALDGDRISRVIQSPGGFTVEHDPVRGDLYLYPDRAAALGPTQAREAATPVTLYVGTEEGFTYRLTLSVVSRDSAQILIRNADRRGAGRLVVQCRRAIGRRLPKRIGGVDPCRGPAGVPAGLHQGCSARVPATGFDRGNSACTAFVRGTVARASVHRAGVENPGRGRGGCGAACEARRIGSRGGVVVGPGTRSRRRAARGGGRGEPGFGDGAMSRGDARNQGIERGQWLLFSALAGVGLLGVRDLDRRRGRKQRSCASRHRRATGGPRARLRPGWVRQSETRLGGIEARVREIEAGNRRLENENVRLQGQLREQAEDAAFDHRRTSGTDRRTDRPRRHLADGAFDRAVRFIGCATAGGGAVLDRAT